MHTAETQVLESSTFEVEMATEKLKRHKLPEIDQIPVELIRARSRTIQFEVHKLINSFWNKVELPEEWKESTIVPVYKKGDKTDCNNYTGISLLSTMYKFYPSSCCQGLLQRQRKLLGIISVDFNTPDPLLIVYSAFVK
jgi:hypothetical protein